MSSANHGAVWLREEHIVARNIEYLGSGDHPEFESGAFFSQMESAPNVRFERSVFGRCIRRDVASGDGGPPQGSLRLAITGHHATNSGGFYFAEGGLDRGPNPI